VILEETLFPAAVVWFDAPPEHLSAEDRLFYGQYDKSNRAMIALLKHLTGGRSGSDRASNKAVGDWKKFRVAKASQVMKDTRANRWQVITSRNIEWQIG
jgi:hypothetical protein